MVHSWGCPRSLGYDAAPAPGMRHGAVQPGRPDLGPHPYLHLSYLGGPKHLSPACTAPAEFLWGLGGALLGSRNVSRCQLA